MYRDERSLVRRHEGKPFSLLGITRDTDLAAVRKEIQKEQLSWRSWWDDDQAGPGIAQRWNVHSWPTVYVLDHKGVIRFKSIQGKKLDVAVDQLLRELDMVKKP